MTLSVTDFGKLQRKFKM